MTSPPRTSFPERDEQNKKIKECLVSLPSDFGRLKIFNEEEIKGDDCRGPSF